MKTAYDIIVRPVLTEKSYDTIADKKYVFAVTRANYDELLEAGVRIYEYTPGFIHAKSVLVDRKMALIGSTNMDYRTFQLHFECAAMLYDTPVVEELLEDLDAVMAESTLYTIEDWSARPWYRRAAATLLKLGAIWL